MATTDVNRMTSTCSSKAMPVLSAVTCQISSDALAVRLLFLWPGIPRRMHAMPSGRSSSHSSVLNLNCVSETCASHRAHSNTSHEEAAAPALKRNVRRWQNAISFEHDNPIEIRLLVQGAREVLAIELDAHVVAVVPPGAAAAR